MAARRIVYAGFATRRHSGGVHVITQHIALLRAAGEDAWLWLPGPIDRLPWVADDLPTLVGPTLELGADDLLLVPETPVLPELDPAPGVRKVIFNQNHFYTFAAGDTGALDVFPSWRPAPGVWVVSEESRDVLRAALPGVEPAMIPNPVDGELFRPRATDRVRVAWFPKKRPRESSLLRRLLAVDPRLSHVELAELIDAPREEVVETLGTSTVFLALGHTESFGLPVAEALASGCLVIGYDGGGGKELFMAPGAWRIPEQRPLLLVNGVADLVRRIDQLAPLRTANRGWVLERYPFSRTAAALQAAVASAYALPGGAGTATHPAGWLKVLGPRFTAFA